MQKTILLIEDNHRLASALAEQLPNCMVADTMDSAMIKIESAKPQAVIIGNAKCGACDNIRQLLPHSLMIELGKDLKPPFHIKELLALLASHESIHSSRQEIFRIGDYDFSAPLRKLESQRLPTILLTDRETEVLEYLCHHAKKLVVRRDLLQHIWGYQNDTETHTLETYIYRLRQKLGEFGDHLETQDGGYILHAIRLSEQNA